MKKVYDEARKLYQPKVSEEIVLREIVQRLAFNKIKSWRIVERLPGMSKRLSTAGMPDLYCRAGNLQFWIEVKRPGGKLRPSQAQFIAESQADGVCAFKADCWDAVVLELAREGVQIR